MDQTIESARIAAIRDVVEKTRAKINAFSKHVKSNFSSPSTREYKLAEQLEILSLDLHCALKDLEDPSPKEEIVEEKPVYAGHRPKRIERHESFGVVKVARVSGSVKLFGSVLNHHDHFIELAVSRAEAQFTEGDDRMTAWPSSKIDNEIVSIYLSSAQFADMITNMNVGLGVPCTLSHVRGRTMARVPDTHENRADRVLQEFKKQMQEAPKENQEAFAGFTKLLEESGLSKAKQATLLQQARKMHSTHADSVGYVLERANEAAERTISHVKAEVDATLTMITHNLGLKKLQEMHTALPEGEVVDIKTLTSGDKK